MTMSDTKTREWSMTATQGRRWRPKSGGRTVILEKGVWNGNRWLNPDEIEDLKSKHCSACGTSGADAPHHVAYVEGRGVCVV